jgi:NAD(P)-dependent dehydrogenase (short-subunit alcohol dehydrogenase family)
MYQCKKQQCGPVVNLADEQPAAHVKGDIQRRGVGPRHLHALQRHVRAVITHIGHRRVEEEGQERAGQDQDDECVQRDFAAAVLSINLDGTFFILRAALRAMTPRGCGSVVVVGSSVAFDAPTAYPHHSASKAGVHALAQAVAKEAITFGIRVNVVAPGPTDTGMAARIPAALRGSMSDPSVRRSTVWIQICTF